MGYMLSTWVTFVYFAGIRNQITRRNVVIVNGCFSSNLDSAGDYHMFRQRCVANIHNIKFAPNWIPAP